MIINQIDNVYEFSIYRITIILSDTNFVNHNGISVFYEAGHFFADSSARSRFINRKYFGIRGIIKFNIYLFAEIRRITALYAKFIIGINVKFKIFIHIFTVNTHRVNSTAAMIPGILNTGYEAGFTTGFGIIRFTESIGSVFDRINRYGSTDRTIESRTNDTNAVGSTE